MLNSIIETKYAPTPIGPYSQAVFAGNLLFISGQIALVPGTPDLAIGSIAEETKQVMNNLKAILHEGGINFSNVVKTTIFLSDMSHFSEVNEIYATYFIGAYPSRETVAVKGLPKNVNIEISMIAVK